MEITGIDNNTGSKLLFKDFQPGQRFQVEIIKKTSAAEGLISIAGKEVSAVLETFAEAGDRIWVKVSKSNENELILIRENAQKAKPANPLMLSQQDSILYERGLPPNNEELLKLVQNVETLTPELIIYIQDAINGNFSAFHKEISSEILNAIPLWSMIEENQNSQQIISFLKSLGLNYEQLILDFLTKDKNIQTENFKKTLKYKLLNHLQGKDKTISSEDQGRLEQLLDELTGQQLWLRTGNLENAYVLFQFPLLEQKSIYNIKVAMESSRQGGKMDAQHCHLAVLANTPSLGEIGIEAWIYRNSISLKVLSDTPEIFQALVDEVKQETLKGFALIGFELISINSAQLKQADEFNNFILGRRRNGVDIRT